MSKREVYLPHDTQWSTKMIAESKSFVQISAYMDKNIIKLSLEAEITPDMAFEANA